MARQQAAQRPIERGRANNQGGEQASSSAVAMIQFGPELAVQAIVFHLADEGISEQVTEQSARATVLRLRRSSPDLAIEQAQWAEMSNGRRLEWLLQQTQTSARLISDETSVLEPAGA